MSVTTTCRDVAELLPVAQQACRLLFQECFKESITDIFITETYRSKERQAYLYAQGRTRPGNIVTWTLNSNHASRLAWDIAVAPPKSLYDVATLNKVGAIARKLNITWGGDWQNNIDRPHFEVKTTWKASAGYKLEGTVIIPTSSKERVKLILEGDEDELKLYNYQWEVLEKNVGDLLKEKVITDESWLTKTKNKTLTVSELAWLNNVVLQRLR